MNAEDKETRAEVDQSLKKAVGVCKSSNKNLSTFEATVNKCRSYNEKVEDNMQQLTNNIASFTEEVGN